MLLDANYKIITLIVLIYYNNIMILKTLVLIRYLDDLNTY
jgi:hypothetical protein